MKNSRHIGNITNNKKNNNNINHSKKRLFDNRY